MVSSKRLKADARAHQAQNPGTSYREALRAISAPSSPDTAGDPVLTPPPALVATAEADHIPNFFEVLGIEDIDTHDFTEVWKRTAAGDSLRFPFAYQVADDALTSEIDYLDLVEENRGGHGPHGALAGRTGSGKSHMLRAIVLALAALYGPDTVNFVLADFKDGVTFLGLDKLPHTAISVHGLENDLDQVTSLAAVLTAEIRRREEFISTEHACKDIYDYRDKQRKNADPRDLPPLPHLLVIFDESSELLRHSPQFQETLAYISRVGRALGVHLLLSSQYIDRAETGDVFEHLSYRIALALNSPVHSLQLIGTDDAATLTSRGAVRWKALRRFAQDTEPMLVAGLDHEAPLDRPGREQTSMGWALIDRLATIESQPDTTLSKEGMVQVVLDRQRAQFAELRTEIDAIIGQASVKEQLHALVSAAQVESELRRRGLNPPASAPRHIILEGAPGIGKSHVAELIGRILHAAGQIRTSRVTNSHRALFVGAFAGESGAKTKAMLDKARGGVLYIDDAYDLVHNRNGSDDPFGTEALQVLTHALNNTRDDLAVIIGGFEASMRRFLNENPGLASYFGTRISFDRFTATELWQHLLGFAERDGRVIDPDAEKPFIAATEALGAVNSDGRHLIDVAGNIRFVRNVYEVAQHSGAQRLSGVEDLSALTDEDLLRVTAEDIAAALRRVVKGFGVELPETD